MYGYIGKLLFVNLSTSEIDVRPLEEGIARKFLGGPGLGAYILYKEMPANTDVFAPESMIGFIANPLNGTSALCGGRYTVVSKSPVYNGWNDCNSGGYFGVTLKKAGFDAVFVKGIAEHPIYIFIDDGKVEIRDARHLWGKKIIETENTLKEELGDKINAAIIGPGGERLSYMAAIMNDSHRAAARGGSGAVMGSKNLKAIVVRGSHKVEVFDKQKITETNKEVMAYMKNGPTAFIINAIGALGTNAGYVPSVFNGDAGIKNWGGAGVALVKEEQAVAMSSMGFEEKHRIKGYTCSTCPVGCGAIYKFETDGQEEETGRPEYETAGAFAANLLNFKSESLLVCNHLCNEYGLDTISVGGTVAWLMECYNEGVLTKEELDGIELKWGDSEAIVEITKKICDAEGCGKLFSKGSRYAAMELNKGFDFLVEASGIEEPQHDSRYAPGLARMYKYDPAPGRHVQGGLNPGYGMLPPGIKYNYQGTGFQDLIGVSNISVVSAAGYCIMGTDFGFNPELKCKLINAVTGFNYSLQEFNALGLRIFTMRHAFNLREGLRRKDFTLSKRMIEGPEVGPLAGVNVDVERLADNLYNALGWNTENAVPSKEALDLLGGMEFIYGDILPPPPTPPAPPEGH